jgi:hypothetical protein
MQPWNVNISSAKDEDIEIERRILWSQMEAKDFYFAILAGSEREDYYTTVFIVPVEYFDEHHKMILHSMPIMHLIPEYFVETHECTFSTAYNHIMVNNNLVRCGFRSSKRFQDYIEDMFVMMGASER